MTASGEERRLRLEAAQSRRDIRRALSPRTEALAVTEVHDLIRRLRRLDEPLRPLKLAVVRTFAVEPLRPYWEMETLLQGFDLTLHECPYGSTVLEAAPGSGLAAFGPDCTFALFQWEDLEPALGEAVAASAQDEVRSRVVATAGQWLAALRHAISGLLVVAPLPRLQPLGLGLHDAMSVDSESAFRRSLQEALVVPLRDTGGIHYCDLEEAVRECGETRFFDRRLWHSARFPFSGVGAQAVVRRLTAFPTVAFRPALKCIVVDADNTLWGGIVGEDGPDGIALGPEYPGSVYRAFQRRLLAFQQRGLLLALCSRNNPEDVLEILRTHPQQVLRESHFAALAIGWQPKAQALASIAKQLNLGLESLLFVDDSPHECLAVESQLPEVEVVTTPTRLVDLPACLDDIARLERLERTGEDLRRTALYAEDRRRQEASASLDPDAYLASLEMKMRVGFDDRRHVSRIAQLTQKTNQFNLTTRRYTEADILRTLADPMALVMHFSLRDIFGDSGIVGVAIARQEGPAAEIEAFLMSCRVIGRHAETSALGALLDELGRRGVQRVRGRYLPSAKNQLVRDFWTDHGFRGADETTFTADIPIPDGRSVPIEVEIGKAAQEERA